MIDKITEDFLAGNIESKDLWEFIDGDNDVMLCVLEQIEDYLEVKRNVGKTSYRCSDCGKVAQDFEVVCY